MGKLTKRTARRKSPLVLKGAKGDIIKGEFTVAPLEQLDGRLASVKIIKRRLEALRRDANVDSVQKEMLCQRAVFLCLQLEALERKAAEGEPIHEARYVQGCNSLLGVLRALGLDSVRRCKRKSLRQYVEETG